MIHNDSKYLKSKIGKELFTNFTLNNVYFEQPRTTNQFRLHPSPRRILTPKRSTPPLILINILGRT